MVTKRRRKWSQLSIPYSWGHLVITSDFSGVIRERCVKTFQADEQFDDAWTQIRYKRVMGYIVCAFGTLQILESR